MRRLLNMVLLFVMAACFVVLPTSIAVATELHDDQVVLATEAEGEFQGEPPGDANAEDNAFRPDDYEPNFLWGAAVGLAVLTVVGVGGVGLLYRAMVQRQQDRDAHA